MSDVNANIKISVDSSQALAQLRALQTQISDFNRSVIAGNVAAAQAQRDLTRNLTAQINASGAFTTSITNVESSVSRLGRAIDKNKLSLGEYFRYGIAASGTFGKRMREHSAITDLATERVKRLQTQYLALEQAHNGYTRSLAVRPTSLFNADSAIAIQRQQIFNKLLGDGSTALVNWGKNTQWAGRQLMVGFTVPLTIFGGMAGKIFMDLEKQVVQFKRVYGDLSTPTGERNAMVEEVKMLGKEFTKYGITVSDTVALAAKAAATGATGADLIAQTTEATRLATLGQIDYQQALDATISLQTAFGISSNDLADATNFLNAVENQTVTSLDDITQAIPLVAPVIKGLGGDVRDLAVFMTAMREGGISANEGANALKSGLASLINPTKAAREQLAAVGINIDTILSKNKGDLRGLISEFGTALGTLGKFERQQTLAKMFGKYQFARMGALFANISKEGSQAARVMDLTAMSAQELGQIAEGELGQLEQAVGVKFTAAVEKLKLAIAPIGEAFLKIATPIVEWVTKIADAFNNLPDGAKTFITWGTAIAGVLVPTIIMLVGLLGNFAGNMLKIGAAIGKLMGKTVGLGSDLEYLTMEELDAMAAAASLEGQTNSLTSALNVQRSAVNALAKAYGSYVAAAGAAAANIPQGFRGQGPAPRKMARGGMVGGTGNKDSEPALLMPGEFVINADASKKFAPLLSAINSGQYGMYRKGRDPFNIDLPSGGSREVNLDIDFSQSAWAAMKRRLQNAADQGEQVLDAVISELSSLANSVVSRIETVDEKLRSAKMSSVLPQSARQGGGVRYSYPGGESPADQMAAIGMAQNDIEREVKAATISGQGARTAIIEQRDLLSKIGDNFEEVDIEAGYARSHAVEVDKSTRDLSNWTADKWELQSQLENNLITTLKGSKRSLEGVIGHLQDANVSQERIDSLLDKINRNVALTEQDFDTLAIGLRGVVAEAERVAATGDAAQIAALRGSKGNEKYSPALHRQAIGALGAYEARRAAGGVLYSDRIDRSKAEADAAKVGVASGEAFENSMVSSAGDVVGRIINDPRNSPHPAVPVAANEDGSKYGTDFTQSAVAAMKKSGQKLGTAVTPFGVVQEIEAQREERKEALKRKAIEADINREIQRRQMLLVRDGISAQAALRIAREEVLAERELLETKQKQSQVPVVPPNAKMLPIVPSGATPAGTEIQQQSGVIARGAKSFGQALTKGSAKLMGASFALDGLIFGLSMMDNGVGEFAQKIMPVVFGLQSLQMLLPALLSPVGLLVGGFAALAALIVIGRNRLSDIFDKAQKNGESMAMSFKNVSSIADAFGKKISTFGTGKIGFETKQKNAAQQYFETEQGAKQFAALQEKRLQVGRDSFVKTTAQEVATAAISAGLSGKEIDAYISTLAEKMNDKQLYIQLRGELASMLDPRNQSDILKNGLLIKVNAEAAGDFLKERFMPNENTLKNFYKDIQGFRNPDVIQKEAVQNAIDYNAEMEKTNRLINEYANKRAEASNSDEFTKYDKLWLQAKDRYVELQNLAGQAAHTMNYNNMETKDYAKNLEDASKWGTIFGSKLMTGNQYLQLQQKLLDDGSIKQKKYNKNVEEAQSGFAKLGTSIKQSIRALQAAGDDQALEGFVKGIGDQLFANLDENLRKSVDEALSGIKDSNARVDIEIAYAKGSLSAQDIVDISNKIDGIPDFSRSDIILAYGNGSLTLDELTYLNQQASILSGFNGTQIGFLITVSGLENVMKAMSIIQQINQLGPVTDSNFSQYTALQNQLSALPKDQPLANVNPKGVEGINPDPNPDGNGGGSGSGNKEKSWLQQKIEEMKANSRLYATATKWVDELKKERGLFFGRIQQLRTGTRVIKGGEVKGGFARMPEQLIEEIGAGPEGLKRLQELLGLSKKAFNNFIKRYKEDIMNSTVDMMRSEVYQKNKAKRAQGILEGQIPGLSPNQLNQFKFTQDQMKQLMSNPEWVEGFLNALKKSKRAGNEYLTWTKKWIESLADEQKTPLEQLNDAWSNYSEAVEAAFDLKRIKTEELYAAKTYVTAEGEKNIEQIKELIDKNEDLVRIQQDIIDGKQEEINDLQHSNDLIQQRIDDLRREDELRNRVAESLQHDLDQMAQVENAINKTFEDRINALEKTSRINDYIINQQRKQIGLAQALTEGDVYAAAEAANEMQAAQAQFATDQTRSSLEESRNLALASVTNAQGMTRSQIEAQIATIKEQSYQTSLLIRTEEDKIYKNNLEVRRLSNEIYDIEELKIEPLKNQNEQYQRILDKHEKDLEYALNHLFAAEMTTEEWKKAKAEQEKLVASIVGSTDKINAYRDAWNAAADAARRARDAAAAIGVGTGTTTTPAAGTISWSKNGVGYANDPSAPYYSVIGGAPVFNYGARRYMGGEIKKYSVGAVVGSGARDSVPAMLTPGEYVVRKSMVEKYGKPMLEAINLGSFALPNYSSSFANAGGIDMPSSRPTEVAMQAPPVYNTSYSINVNARTNASPDEIANVVMNKISSIESMSVRGYRGN